MIISSVEDLLRREEGEVLHAYEDSEGLLTIGVGILIDERHGGGLRPEESEFILQNRLQILRATLAVEYPWFAQLDQVRRAVLLSMAWQVGHLEHWPKFLNAMAVRDYGEAAKEMLNSLAARESPARWQRAARMMLSGQWV